MITEQSSALEYEASWRFFHLRNRLEGSPAILLQNQKYTVKLLNSRKEYVKVQKLRYDVFHREFQGKKFPFGFDRDRFESHANHIIVLDNSNGKMIGAYRVIHGRRPEKFYSGSEFFIDDFASIPGRKMELSRACIHRDHRNGIVLAMLWKGVAEFFQRTGASYMFGIPSIKSTEVEAAAKIYHFFQKLGKVEDQVMVCPRFEHRLEGFRAAYEKVASEDPDDLRSLIPPLFKAYLKAGARIAGEPALDPAFGCIDFFMILPKDEMAGTYRRKFMN